MKTDGFELPNCGFVLPSSDQNTNTFSNFETTINDFSSMFSLFTLSHMYFPHKKVVSVLDAQMNDKLFSVINKTESSHLIMFWFGPNNKEDSSAEITADK